MKIKICGMKDKENMEAIARLHPDYLGFIFYDRSPRYMKDRLSPTDLDGLPSTIQRTGVFVNSPEASVLKEVEDYKLDAVQLHGDESPDYVAALRDRLPSSVALINGFGVDSAFDWSSLNDYQDSCDFFLFDTKSPNYGGSGAAFDHTLLAAYDLDKPYFLGGGIGVDNLEAILGKPLPGLAVIDMNSRLELSPGVKDTQKVATAINLIRKYALGA